MALPKLNTTPTYEMVVPSTGKKVSYRPYLVKEEKLLLLAFESGNLRESLRAVLNVISECVDDVDVNTLSTFDIEYMFLKVRGKSVGETTEVVLDCGECEKQFPVQVNVDNVEVEYPEEISNMIPLTDNISLEMRHPSYHDLIEKMESEGDEIKLDASAIATCIVAIHFGEERMNPKDYTEKELEEFVDSMTISQLNEIRQYLESVPTTKLSLEEVVCPCGKKSNREIKGVQNFF